VIYPKISCLCPTYGRPHALEEAMHSFLLQDYPGPKELVIVNDLPDQQLCFDHPEVKIVNLPERIANLGEKFNLTAKEATGDVLAVWDDDDIFLPHRLTYSFEGMWRGLFHTGLGYYEEKPFHIQHASNLFHSCLMLTKKVFWDVGGYRHVDWCGADSLLFQDLIRKYGEFSKTIPDKDRFYIYRWSSVQSYHVSGWSSEKVSSLVEGFIKERIQSGQLPSGAVQLEPRWSYDYTEFLP
jgi:glycosyltransferase involved in cell wall biosynthesis